MVEQLTLSKRLFLNGVYHSEANDPVSSGMAISMFQDSVEVFIWSLLKDLDAQLKEHEPFIKYFDKVAEAPNNIDKKTLPFRAKMLELNKARVNFKHYGNLPDPSEAIKFQAYTKNFLIESFRDFCSVDFEYLSLADLIVFSDVKKQLKESERLISESDYSQALEKSAIAKSMLFSKMEEFFPKIDYQISRFDDLIEGATRVGRFKGFEYMAKYLNASRESHIIAMLGVPLKEYVFIQNHFPFASRMMDQSWRIHWGARAKVSDEAIAKKATTLMVNLSIKTQTIIG